MISTPHFKDEDSDTEKQFAQVSEPKSEGAGA